MGNERTTTEDNRFILELIDPNTFSRRVSCVVPSLLIFTLDLFVYFYRSYVRKRTHLGTEMSPLGTAESTGKKDLLISGISGDL